MTDFGTEALVEELLNRAERDRVLYKVEPLSNIHIRAAGTIKKLATERDASINAELRAHELRATVESRLAQAIEVLRPFAAYCAWLENSPFSMCRNVGDEKIPKNESVEMGAFRAAFRFYNEESI